MDNTNYISDACVEYVLNNKAIGDSVSCPKPVSAISRIHAGYAINNLRDLIENTVTDETKKCSSDDVIKIISKWVDYFNENSTDVRILIRPGAYAKDSILNIGFNVNYINNKDGKTA